MSQTTKVYEFAKELNMETLALMDKIKKWKLPVKSHMSSLDEDLMKEIQVRLSEDSRSKSKKKTSKKITKKKTAAKKVTKKKTAAKKVTKKKTATKKVAATLSSAKKVSAKIADSEKPAVGKTVIRRKAKDVAARETLVAKRAEEEKIAKESGVATPTTDSPSAVDSKSTEKKSSFGRIVGRMDLSQARKNRTSSGDTGERAASTSQRTPLRPQSGRNIRTGFVAPMPIHDISTAREAFKEKEKKKKTSNAKEQKPINFAATEFRKREIIFQPKKKRIMTTAKKKTQITIPKASKRIIYIYNTITLQALADQMKMKAGQLMKKFISEGVTATMNSQLDFDTVSLIASEFNFEVRNTYCPVDDKLNQLAFGDLKCEPVTRPPIVTVMGHVDHGKTTLLDAIRSADVVSGEAGGITQHIGAYRVTRDNKVATFIDTPGHEAFTAMRERGAHVTDIVILVVAADDGVMPQTEEAISHAKASNVPIIVAVNKMDRPDANMDKIKQQLAEYELTPEDWGGTTIYVGVSALQKTGIDELLEQIHLTAEMQELKSNPKRSGTGIVIESRMDKGKGCVATLIVKDGSLRTSDAIVVGMVSGKVRMLTNENGEAVSVAGAGEPVEILGLSMVPQSGDRFDVCQTEDIAEKVAEQRKLEAEKENRFEKDTSLESIFSKIKSQKIKELSIVLKSDMVGTNEAIKGMLAKIKDNEVKINIIHTGVGGISGSDVLLAAASDGLIVGFNVRPDANTQRTAKEKGIEIKTYSIIYELVDDLKLAMTGMLSPDFIEEVLGQAEVRETFSVPKIGLIAGCSVIDGKIKRGGLARLIREGKIIYEGAISSLKRFKDDAKEVQSGYECGIGIENYNDIKVSDVIEAFEKKEVKRSLGS